MVVHFSGVESTRATISSLSTDRIYLISVATRNDDGTGNASGTQMARLRSTKTVVVDDRPVVVVYSYKEGILVGVCIAALCLAVCAFILYMRFRYAFQLMHYAVDAFAGNCRSDSMGERSERPSSRNSSWTAILFRRRRRTPAGAVKLVGGLNGAIVNGNGSGKTHLCISMHSLWEFRQRRTVGTG